MVDFGAKLKALRLERGLSGIELARRTNIAQSYISSLETGKTKKPNKKTLQRLTEALGVTYDYFFNPDEDNKLNKKAMFALASVELSDFLRNPNALPYVEFAKELYDKGINVDLLKSAVTILEYLKAEREKN